MHNTQKYVRSISSKLTCWLTRKWRLLSGWRPKMRRKQRINERKIQLAIFNFDLQSKCRRGQLCRLVASFWWFSQQNTTRFVYDRLFLSIHTTLKWFQPACATVEFELFSSSVESKRSDIIHVHALLSQTCGTFDAMPNGSQMCVANISYHIFQRSRGKAM